MSSGSQRTTTLYLKKISQLVMLILRTSVRQTCKKTFIFTRTIFMKQREDILLFDFTSAACKMKWDIFFFF